MVVASKKTRIVFLDRGTIGPTVKLRSPGFEHDWQDYQQTSADEVIGRLQHADIAITNKVAITASMLPELPHLRCIAVAATGANMLDLTACHAAGVVVCNIQGYAKHTVPEHTFAALLALRRNLFEYRDQVNSGVWQEAKQFCFFNRPIHDLHGATLSLLGTGTIAQETGRLGEAFGMQVQYHSLSNRTDSGLPLVDFETLVTTADVLSIHCPLNQASHAIIDDQVFARMKKSALLVNTARGQIVDIAALSHALQQQQIAGAAIDVCDDEPPASDAVVMKLATLPNFLLTPHIAWASVNAMQILTDQLIDNLEAFAAGHPKNVLK